MKISVIIPVYNAAAFVTEAVESALMQPETSEVILVEDGSTDSSLVVCKGLEEKYAKVRLLRHPGGKNRGESASRNLGMRSARFNYLAFIDADDFYLPDRFATTKEIFNSCPDCDGVYEAIGIHFQDEVAKERWLASPMANVRITTVTEKILPENLFEALVKGGSGHFSMDGLTLKKSILTKSDYMNENIFMHPDTEFIYRLAAVGKLLSGNIEEPIAVRRVHGHNMISEPRSEKIIYKDRVKIWRTTYTWLKKRKLDKDSQLVLEKYLDYCQKFKPLPFSWMNKLPKEFRQLVRLFLLIFEFPSVIFTKAYWKFLFSVKLLPVFKKYIRKII